MSSESDNEEFHDAIDVTPIRSKNDSEDKIKNAALPKASAQSPLPVSSRPSFFTKKGIASSPPYQSMLTVSQPLKLAASLPTLHIDEESVVQPQVKSHHSNFLRTSQDAPVSIQNMPAPVIPPPINTLNPIDVEVTKAEEETSSACSGSLLESLGIDDEGSRPNSRGRGKRLRQKDRRPVLLDEDEDALPFPLSSPTESRSSSVDAVYPATQTAPFRVVEHDSTSVYSSTFSYSQDKQFLKSSANPESEPKHLITNVEPPEIMRPIVPDTIPPVVNKFENIPVNVALAPEPDIVASTKSNSLPRAEVSTEIPGTKFKTTGLKESIPNENETALISSTSAAKMGPPPPVPPPRKNKKHRRNKDDDAVSLSSTASLPVPSLSVAIKEGDDVSHCLDLNDAIQGDYIVKPNDRERCRAIGTYESDLSRVESDTTSQASTPERPRTTSSHYATAKPDATKIEKKESLLTCQAPPPPPPTFESILKARPMMEADQAKELTDQEILSQVNVLNLDTGECIPLSEADTCLPSSLNPLSLQILKRTKEFYSNLGMDVGDEDSDEGTIADVGSQKIPEFDSTSIKRKTSQLKKLIGRTMGSAVNKAKTLAHEVSSKGKEEKDVFENDAPAQNTMQFVKIKTSHSHKGPLEFDNLLYVQELKGDHTGPVWCMRFSPCGRLLATAGQDHILRVWVLKQAFNYFLDIRTKWNADVKSSPTPSQESLVSQQSSHSSEDIGVLDPDDDGVAPFMPKPFCVYSGHTADVLDLSWSKNYFMLTSSMDKTVRLWHISRKECLCIFKHVDFVTASAFHPKDDRYFISGSLDGKLRLWSIPDKQVVLWNEVEGHPKLITAANFCQNGAFTVIGTYNGRCIFYKTSELKYYTQIHVKSSRGKNSHGRKITGIEPLPDEDKLMITSNDSRIRLYDLNVLNVSCKYKGYSNISSQIRAGFSHDGKYIVAGSENQCIYLWKTHHDYSKFSSARKDRNVYWEGVKAHSAVVTCAIFSPHPEHVFSFIEQQEKKKQKKESRPTVEKDTSNKGYILVSADFNGCIKVFQKKEKPKSSSLPASAMS